MHGDILQQLLEVVGAGHEVALAVHLEQHADLAAGVDVGSDCAFVGGAGGLLGGRGHALLAQDHNRFFHIALRFNQRGTAIHHGRAGLFAEILYLCSEIVLSHGRHPLYLDSLDRLKFDHASGASRA